MSTKSMGTSTQTHEEDRTIQDLVSEADLSDEATEFIEILANQLDEVRQQAESANNTARRSQKRVIELREELSQRDDTIQTQADRITELEDEVAQLRDRTGLLETVKDGSSMKIEKRAAVLVQTLYNEAWSRKESNAEVKARAQMDYKAANSALGGGVSRDMIYRTFEKAEVLVDDDDVVWFVKESRGADQNSRLVLDLESGDIPSRLAGQEIAQPGGR